MLTILPETIDDLLAVRVSEKFTAEDFERYSQLIKDRIGEFGQARLYFEMVEFDGWEAGSFIENGVFDISHGNQFGRVAMIGEKKWQELAAKLASPVKREGIKYFDSNEKELAMNWVRGTGTRWIIRIARKD